MFERAAFWLALGSAVAGSVSIAISQILLGAALASLLAGRVHWRVPRHWVGLAVFAGWTVLSLALSDAPGKGVPQVRKFFVWLLLFAVLTTFRTLADARLLTLGWVTGATLSALRGLWQFGAKYQQAAAAGQEFYSSYVASRITGFNSHWMTFSGQMMIALLFGASLLCWGKPRPRERWFLVATLPIIALALLLAFTRGIWIATALGIVYLAWYWKRWTIALIPLAALVAFFAGPAGLRERMTSILKPRGEMDSNLHRVYTFRVGVEMIRAHPLFGMGPERVGPHVQEYIPKDLPQRLPEGYYGHLHNIYIHLSAERGIPAMLGLLWFLVATQWDWLRGLRRGAGNAEWVLRAGVATMLGVLVTGLFEYNLGDSEILGMTAAFIGAVCAVSAQVQPLQQVNGQRG
jgi:O-antigen ligase